MWRPPVREVWSVCLLWVPGLAWLCLLSGACTEVGGGLRPCMPVCIAWVTLQGAVSWGLFREGCPDTCRLDYAAPLWCMMRSWCLNPIVQPLHICGHTRPARHVESLKRLVPAEAPANEAGWQDFEQEELQAARLLLEEESQVLSKFLGQQLHVQSLVPSTGATVSC